MSELLLESSRNVEILWGHLNSISLDKTPQQTFYLSPSSVPLGKENPGLHCFQTRRINSQNQLEFQLVPTLNLRERGRSLSFSKTHAVCSLSASTISSPPTPLHRDSAHVCTCRRMPQESALCVMIFSPNLFHFLCMQLSFPLKDLDRLWKLKPRKKKFLFSFSFVIPLLKQLLQSTSNFLNESRNL